MAGAILPTMNTSNPSMNITSAQIASTAIWIGRVFCPSMKSWILKAAIPGISSLSLRWLTGGTYQMAAASPAAIGAGSDANPWIIAVSPVSKLASKSISP